MSRFESYINFSQWLAIAHQAEMQIFQQYKTLNNEGSALHSLCLSGPCQTLNSL